MKKKTSKRPSVKSGRVKGRPASNGISIGQFSAAELLRRHPSILHVFEDYGIHFCAGCFLTLTQPLERAATYHAVTDLKGLWKDIERAVNSG